MSDNALFIKHLPSSFTPEDREELLKLVGAVNVRIMPDTGRMKYTAFAVFPTHQDAKIALSLLHQREILGRKLVVEFAKKEQSLLVPHESDYHKFKPLAKENSETSERDRKKKEMDVLSKKIHGLAPKLGLDYLPNPLLKYKYPPPTPIVLQNIAHALVSVPKFYTQVLHLMNKMNLPCPFGPLTPAPPVQPDVVFPEELAQDSMDIEEESPSEEESEIESEKEEGTPKLEKVMPQKRKAEKPKRKIKRQKLADMLPPAPAVSNASRIKVEPSEVFESTTLSQKKISMKNIVNLPPVEAQPTEIVSTEGFGAIEPPKPSEADDDDMQGSDSESSGEKRFISSRELRKKRLSQREMNSMSLYRNFSPGEPTFRLYIKNLAKQVTEKDLTYIFGRFINWDSEEEKNMFDVRLMKEGRMKGQAFVTLANELQAKEAMHETNGFVLHTKPLVVQFARSAKPKEQDKTKKS